MARNTPATSMATRETIRAAMRRVSQRRMKLSSGGRLARTSRWEKEKSTTGAACCWASSRSDVVSGELAIPCSNVQVLLKERSCAAHLCARSHERFDPGLRDGALQPFLESHLGLPPEDLLGQRDVRLAHLGIIRGQ